MIGASWPFMGTTTTIARLAIKHGRMKTRREFIAASLGVAVAGLARQDQVLAQIPDGSSGLKELRDLGYYLPEDYGVDTTGATVCTTQLQNCVNAAQADNHPIWFGDGHVYLVDDTIHMHGYAGTDWVCIHGSSRTRPKIVLQDDSRKFSSAWRPRPVVVSRALHSAEQNTYPSNPLSDAKPFNNLKGNHFGHTFINFEVDCGDNPGAFGFYLYAAQRCFAANLKVTATDALGGFWGTLGTSCPMMNIEVTGGVWQISNEKINEGETNAGSLIVGLTLVGDSRTKHAFKHEGFCPLVVVGFDVTFPNSRSLWTVDSGRYNSSGTGQINFIDGYFRVGAGSAPVIDNTKFRFFGGSKNMYMRNVHVTGRNNIIRSGSESMVSAEGSWKTVNEYCYTEQGSENAASGWYSQYSMIDGTTSRTPEPATDIAANASVPTTDYIGRHTITVPMVDSGPYINILDHGAEDIGSFSQRLFTNGLDEGKDSHGAIQKAIRAAKTAGHNRVVVPRGTYLISDTISLDSDTIFIGVHPYYSNMSPHNDWRPTSAVFCLETPDDANGTCHVSNLGFLVPEKKGAFSKPTGPYANAWFSNMKWRTGKHSSSVQQRFDRQYNPSNYYVQNPRYYHYFEGSAGGRHYSCTEHDGRNWGSSDSRGLLITGTSAPLHIYGFNCEANKAGSPPIDFNAEVVNSANVRFYSNKREGHAPTLRVHNSTNVAYYGLGRQLADNGGTYGNYAMNITGSSANVLFAPITYDGRNQSIDSTRSMVRQDVVSPSGVYVGPDWPRGVSLYKLGTLDDAAMVIESRGE